jgi:alpha-beta hydrolase superfamily lysophospholipase
VVLGTPVLDRPITSTAAPAGSYVAALALAERLRAADGPEVDSRCWSRVIDHGRRTRVAVVLLHGYTNCPQQSDRIARAYADLGVSVVVPRLPGHGQADRLTRALSDLTPAALAATADLAVDIAAGLGEQVHVVGASAGGTLAAWLASERDEVERLTLIAPLAVPQPLPEAAVRPVARAVRLAPDAYVWWDRRQRERLATPPYAYPRFSTRGLGAFLEIGRATRAADPATIPRLGRLTLVVNENDAAVSIPAARRIADVFSRAADERVDHVFPAAAGYGHDLIDPEGENAARIDEIYGLLGPLLDLPDLAGR